MVQWGSGVTCRLIRDQIGLTVVQHDAIFAKCDITYVPILLGGVMKSCGNVAPLAIKSKLDPTKSCRTAFFTLESALTADLLPVLHLTCLTEQKDKDIWIEVERVRWAKAFNIPMKEEQPPDFPPMTLNIIRALCALTALHPDVTGNNC